MRSTAPSQIGLDHAGIGLHVARRALGDLLAVVEHGDTVGDSHHDAHVVLDEEHGQTKLGDDAPEQGHQRGRLRLRHAGGRPGVGGVEAGEDVEQRRLAGAVGADDRGDPTVEREIDAVDGGEAAEPLGHSARLEARHRSSRWRRRAGRIPCGRKIIMSTRMMPKIIRSYFAGSNWVGKSARLNPRIVTPAFFNSLSQSEKPLRTWRFSTVTAMAPRTAPGIDPMPPRITIERTPIDSRKVNDSGLMKSCLAEKTTPMTPANEAPHAKARSFARTSGTPMAWAATSSSRMASHARPMCESSSRRLTTMTTATMRSTRK